MAEIAFEIAMHHRKQLRALGFEDAIPDPKERAPRVPSAGPKITQRLVVVTVHGGFALQSPYDPELVQEIKGSFRNRRWDAPNKVWEVGVNLNEIIPFASEHGFELSDGAAAKIAEIEAAQRARIEASKAESADYAVEGLGGTLRPFQAAGVKYAVEIAKGRVLIADEMGLGKTIQALAVAQKLGAFPLLVVCPASLKLNWQREAAWWLPGKTTSIVNGTLAPADVTIINYDIIGKHLAALKARGFKLMVLDESHYVKNYKAKRTQAIKELSKVVQYRVCLTGTPVLNRPRELITQLEMLGRLEAVGGFWNMMNRYCGGADSMYEGATNLEELNLRLRESSYIRREKINVLKELPAKQRTTVPLKLSNAKEYAEAESNFIAYLGKTAGEKAIKNAEAAAHLVEIEGLKQLAVKGKMDAAVEWVSDFLESGESLVLFAHHRDVVDALAAKFPNAVVLRGADSSEARQAAVDAFQAGKTNLFIGSLKAGGVGITLTKASNVAFLELGWTPADHDQAEDRVHRIGQTNAVNAWYLLALDTIDGEIAELIAEKRAVVSASTVGGEANTDSVLGELLSRMRAKKSQKA